MKTKWQVYEELENEFNEALPQKADDCEISIHEAQCDRFGKDWDKFHDKINEEFVFCTLNESEDKDE